VCVVQDLKCNVGDGTYLTIQHEEHCDGRAVALPVPSRNLLLSMFILVLII